MLTRRLALKALIGASVLPAISRAEARAPEAPEAEATYSVRHALTVKDIPPGAKDLRVWFWMPQEEEAQKVLDLVVTQAPPGFQTRMDSTTGHTCLYAEAAAPTAPTLSLVTEFTVCRRAVAIPLDPQKAGPLTERHRTAFAADLRTDVPHMAVDESMRRLAARLCGSETNVVRQARSLYDYVVDNTQHYSKSPTAPKSSNQGDASYCLANGGGACTDMHSLFCALARARGIPTRFCFGSLLREKNEGKEMDPGYRCWVLFFVPGYGWAPADMAAANLAADKKDAYFGGLDDRRLLFSRGRDLTLPGGQGPNVNLFIRAYVEVDGKPYAGFDRSLMYVTRNNAPAIVPA